jgi:hypothetical protein
MTNDWKLVLEQNSDLSIASGSTAALAEAVRAGADLRVYMTTPTYEETLYFQQTYAGVGDAFAGIMSHHHSYVYDGQPIDQPYVSLFKYDTSGRFSHVKWMLDDRAIDTSSEASYGVYLWYVCERWRTVYQHDADGNRVKGDLDELQDCIRSGQTIRVGVQQLFGLNEDQDKGPAHTCFLTTMQPLIQDGHVQSNCDFVLIGAPQYPFDWKDGLHLAVMRPSTSGEILCFLAEPGKLPFQRLIRRRAMQWLVANKA